jgi:hypothetical protein
MPTNHLPRHSDEPFGPSLRALLSARELTFRELARMTADVDGKGVSHVHLSLMANAEAPDKASTRAMELVAAACNINPDYFAEYRMRQERAQIDPKVVGFETALKNLNRRMGSARAKRKP